MDKDMINTLNMVFAQNASIGHHISPLGEVVYHKNIGLEHCVEKMLILGIRPRYQTLAHTWTIYLFCMVSQLEAMVQFPSFVSSHIMASLLWDKAICLTMSINSFISQDISVKLTQSLLSLQSLTLHPNRSIQEFAHLLNGFMFHNGSCLSQSSCQKLMFSPLPNFHFAFSNFVLFVLIMLFQMLDTLGSSPY